MVARVTEKRMLIVCKASKLKEAFDVWSDVTVDQDTIQAGLEFCLGLDKEKEDQFSER